MTPITCIEDLRRLFRKRVPRMFVDYTEAGSWTESTLRGNLSAFDAIRLRQKILLDMTDRSLKTRMAGQEVAMPVALAPIGSAGMLHPDGEIKAVAAALYPASALPFDGLVGVARGMTTEARVRVLRTYAGNRENRRHRPGRAFEHATYTFDVVADYGAFRDLQRHRMLTIDWQELTTRHGHASAPDAIAEVGALADWQRVLDDSAALYARLARRCSPAVAQYAVSMAYRIRFYMRMNAREAMHVIELRTSPQGHPAYRRVCQRMHRLIAEQAGHAAIAAAMRFADHSEVDLERLASERALDRKRAARQASP